MKYKVILDHDSSYTMVAARWGRYDSGCRLLYDVFLHSVCSRMRKGRFVLASEDGKPDKGLHRDAFKIPLWAGAYSEFRGNILFVDLDMLMTGDAGSLFDEPFDIAYTAFKRGAGVGTQSELHPMLPYISGGFIAVRASERVDEFMNVWLANDKALSGDSSIRKLNEISLAKTILVFEKDLAIVRLPYKKWHTTSLVYSAKDKTRFVHIRNPFKTSLGENKKGQTKDFLNLWDSFRNSL